jgi:N6-adenosine-specific RNA methylase IME4
MKKNNRKSNLDINTLHSILPQMSDDEYELLKNDIEQNGLRVPLVQLNGVVVDGRARLKACKELGITPQYQVLDCAENDALSVITSYNLTRRQLNFAQKVLICTQLANLQKGSNQHTSGEGLSRKEVAKLFDISTDSIDRANKVLSCENKDLIELFKAGDVPLKTAAVLATKVPDIASMTNEKIEEVVETGIEKFEKEVLRKNKLDQKRQEAAKLALNNPLAMEALTGKYSVIYADPPWDYGGNTNNAYCDPTIHYPTMPLEKIKDLPVKNCLNEDAVIFLWVPNCLIPSGLEVLSAWGFEFVSTMVWCKDNAIPSGAVTSPAHETLMIGKRGMSLHDKPAVEKSWHHEKRAEHSKKPKHFINMIDRLFPGLPKLEMFARQRHSAGWSVFGNEVVGATTVTTPQQIQSVGTIITVQEILQASNDSGQQAA